MTRWSFQDIPDQTGRTALVTGANTGIGLETARMLAQKGAAVVLACRNPAKGQAALEHIMAGKPTGTATLAALDLSDLGSVKDFADQFMASHPRLDLLIHNAGVMTPPLSRTAQGFELQFGTNHLGHFALGGRLLPTVLATPGARVVVVSSTAHHMGRIDFDDLNWTRRSYSAWRAYCQSKLANLLYAQEFARRLTAAGSDVRVTAAHPGWTATDLQRHAGMARFFNPMLAMKPEDGALPTLRAATDPAAATGTYWGPSHWMELNGPPDTARVSQRAQDVAVAGRLWTVSEELTGVTYVFPTAQRAAA